MDFRGGRLACLVLRLFEEFDHADGASAPVIEGLALEILGAVVRSRRPPPSTEQGRQMLDDRFSETLSLGDTPGEVGVHLATVVADNFGKTIGEYVRHLLIEFACRALAESDHSLVGITLRARFSDQSHLFRTFKRSDGDDAEEIPAIVPRALSRCKTTRTVHDTAVGRPLDYRERATSTRFKGGRTRPHLANREGKSSCNW
jgi:AraC-like DNA-binding protein